MADHTLDVREAEDGLKIVLQPETASHEEMR
jgi:hypothetical protein